MKVAIIGSGNVGKALASSATKAGHHVTLTATSPEKAKQVAKTVNAHAAASNQEAVKDAEIVVLAVPANKVDEVVASLAPELDGKYTVFGEVVAGMDTVAKLEENGNPNDGPPTAPLKIVKATIEVD